MKALCIALVVACGLVACFDVRDPFRGPEQVLLTVRLGGSGAGVVESEPAGLACDAGTCTGEFYRGSTVQLFASATTGSFVGWTEACRGRGECAVTVEPDEEIGALFGQPGEALWVKQIGGADEDVGRRIAIDGNNDVIVVGTFEGTIAVDPTRELTSRGTHDVFIVKLDGATGELLWVKQIGGTGDEDIFGVTVDEERNPYIAGSFNDTVDFGNGPTTAANFGADAFVLALDAGGAFRWVRQVDGVGSNYGVGYIPGHIVTDGSSVVLASQFSSYITVDGNTTTIEGGPNVFALSLSAVRGDTLWVKTFGGPELDSISAVALDNAGNAVLTGTFEDSIYFGPFRVTGASSFLVKLAGMDGAPLLARALPGGGGLAVDQENNIFVAGTFYSSADLGCANPLTSFQPGAADLYIAQYTQAGSCIRATRLGRVQSANIWYTKDFTVNANGEVSLAGAFNHSLTLGGPPLQVAGGFTDIYTARFDEEGNHLGSLRAGGAQQDFAQGIAQSADGRFFVTGSFQAFAELGRHTVTSAGFTDAFIAGFAPF